jgi:cyanophycin synthetase
VRAASLIARAGEPGRELARRLDVARSVGVRSAIRLRAQQAMLEELQSHRRGVYRDIWDEAAQAAGAQVRELGEGFLEISRNGASTRVREELVQLDDPVSTRLSFDKPLVHRLLAAEGIAVPEHVEVRSAADAVSFVAAGPTVVKPARGTGIGQGITGGVTTSAELERAALRASRYGPDLLVERQLAGTVYRLLFLDGELLDTIAREPPHVTGDGSATVAELIDAENRRRIDACGREGLWPITVDPDCVLALEREGLSVRAVPEAGRRVQVKSGTNQNAGAENLTVADLPQAIVDESRAAARIVGLRFAGVDVIAPEGARSLAEGGAVIEVNCTPGIHHHYTVADRAAAPKVAIPVLERLLA